ncbi:MAG: hypothetical protein CME26_12970 [Gemmatimonadetes bacterium]|nr:hypothetical protein [Gemmatimonadota bacterium]|tara:strand:- start:4700 stop:5899 length:1200 start_codon:yes stop_codon:yes gene_type:complete
MIQLHFDIRDLFRVIRLGWSGKKIWTGLCGLIVAYVGYLALVTLGFSVSGTSASEVWHQHGLFPGASPESLPLAGSILHVIAMLFAAAILYITSCMMCKITYQQLRGDDFYSSGDAWLFVKSHWGGALFGPIAVLVLLAIFVVTGVIIGWVAGLIPYVGEFAFAIAFIPIFFAALVAVFIVAALAASLLFTPAIVGTVGEDTLEVLIQSFSLCWSQPWRLIGYTAWVAVSVLIGAVLLSGMMTLALGLVTWACGLGMGAKLTSLMLIAQSYLAPIDFTSLFQDVADTGSPWESGSGSRTGSLVWSGRILGVMLILLSGVFLAYVQAAYASGASLIYVILRRKKDDENLLEWEDPDMEDLDFSNFDENKDDEADTSGAGDGERSGEREGNGEGDASSEKT